MRFVLRLSPPAAGRSLTFEIGLALRFVLRLDVFRRRALSCRLTFSWRCAFSEHPGARLVLRLDILARAVSWRWFFCRSRRLSRSPACRRATAADNRRVLLPDVNILRLVVVMPVNGHLLRRRRIAASHTAPEERQRATT